MARGNGDKKSISTNGNGPSTALARTDDPAAAAIDWPRVAKAFGPLALRPDLLERFAQTEGSDDQPWDLMIQLAGLDEQAALESVAEVSGLPFEAEPRLDDSANRFYELVDPEFARGHTVGAIRSDGHAMIVATAQPMMPSVFTMLEDILEMPVELVLTPRAAVASLVNRGYERRGDLVGEIIEEVGLDESAFETAAGALGRTTDLLALARQTPVIRLVNMILFEALRRRASDIHVHPMESRLVIRLRVDGMLVDAFSPPLSLAPAISSRLKVMTELDIANRHSPQDGQTTVRIGSKKVDIRLSVIPTVYGERIVLRLLDQSQNKLSLNSLGMDAGMRGKLLDLVARPNGILLVTGPTGSGKTTTLYAVLGEVDRNVRNVMTVEDPVEYRLDGISQTQVNVKRGVTFASGLRALLRQDPDVILVGEIRDLETAQLAVQASLTGHLVLSTLHTNDAPSAIPRLIDIGIEPFLVTSSLQAILAQRLLRRVDPESDSGYKGRLAVYEIMVMSDHLRKLTAQNADGVTLKEAAIAEGFETMHADAIRKIDAGLTTESEMYRVLH
ncbi:MAG: GspE/PulE family protein [Planctomycetota bacterium]